MFRGLAVHDRWDWSVSHPVVRLSFGAGDFRRPDYLEEDLADQLEAREERAGVAVRAVSAPVRLRRLIRALHDRSGRGVVILVDEYDKPILDAIEEPEIASRNRDALRGLYATIKDCDAHVRFSFLTGVSRFSKAGMFSGLNSPEDLTLNASYSAVCGYTEADLEAVFAPELPGLDRAQIRHWYNGYNWLGKENVYNPYDVLLLFSQREFEAHWFETGTPAFLVNTLRERRVSTFDLEAMTGDRALLSKFDVGTIGTEALLFQSGYLTIKGVERDAGGAARYRLGYPNQEVRQSLNESLLDALAPNASAQLSSGARFRELLGTNDFAGLRELIQAHFDGIPHQWHVRNDIADYEGYYASVFYSCFAALGFDVVAEDSSARGRADLTLRFGGAVYVFEFKVKELAGAGSALSQLRARGYADKYRGAAERPSTWSASSSAARRGRSRRSTWNRLEVEPGDGGLAPPWPGKRAPGRSRLEGRRGGASRRIHRRPSQPSRATARAASRNAAAACDISPDRRYTRRTCRGSRSCDTRTAASCPRAISARAHRFGSRATPSPISTARLMPSRLGSAIWMLIDVCRCS